MTTKMNKFAPLLALLIIPMLAFGAVAPAFADPPEGMHGNTHEAHEHMDHRANINERQHNQQQRINEGVKSGQLTRAEAHKLRSNQRAINRYERQSRADGNGLTTRERMRLQRQQNRQSNAIHQQKHDKQVR
jgi:hypothetical protein